MDSTETRQNNQSFDPDATMVGERARKERGMLQVGDLVLGRYELLEKLGTGAMGMVFLCRDRISGVQYALKMVPPELARDEDAMESVKSNFQLVHNLKHPNIASVDFLDCDEHGAYFLIMEYVQGVNLSRWIREKWNKGGPSLEEVAAIVKQIASALDYAHAEKVLHRDVKPANVMIDGGGRVKVLDFGLASKVRSSLTNLSLNPVNSSGTPNYLPPEQFKAQYPRPASDQYALAVLTYEMLSGHLPFESGNFEVLRSAVINDEPEEIENVPDAAWQAIRRAMSKKPSERFASCGEFSAALTAESSQRQDVEQEERFTTSPAFAEMQGEREMVRDGPGSQPPPQPASPPGWPITAGLGVLIAAVVVVAGVVLVTVVLAIDKRDNIANSLTGEAARWYRKAAAGDATAQNHLGLCYENGNGVDRDLTEAVKWYRKAAEQGNASAQSNLGWCYESGYGVARDQREAVKWFRKAADQGNANAQLYLGVCYKNGEGVPKDLSEAVKWFRKAAEQGYAYAQNNLGVCYKNGEGVPKDLTEAAKWFRKAAEQGDVSAQNNIGVCYYNGEGVSKDLPEAVKWYRKAAEQKNAFAQYNLGWCYENGEGVVKNLPEAVKWYRKAAEQNHFYAQRRLQQLENKSVEKPKIYQTK